MNVLGIRMGVDGYTESAEPPKWYPADLHYYYRDVFQPRYGKNIFDPNLDIVNMNTPSKDAWTESHMSIEEKFNEILTYNPSVVIQEWRSYKNTLLNVLGLQRIIDEVNEKARDMGL
jgi:hypothetical protein